MTMGPSMPPDPNPNPGQDKAEDELAALLCMALDGAAADPVRLSLLTRLALLLYEPDREAGLERIRQSANQTVTRL